MVQNMYRVRTVLSGWPGGPGLSTLYFKTTDPTGPGTTGDAEACQARVHAAFQNMQNMWPAFMRINTDPVIDVIQDVTGALVESHSAPAEPVIEGDAGGMSLPQAAMICINYSTLDIIAGHRVRGRTFLGPLKSNADADGSPTPTQLVQVSEFGDDIIGTELQQVVWHRPKNGGGGKACVVTGHKVADRFAVLRSRRG